jgi:hypothetical protein
MASPLVVRFVRQACLTVYPLGRPSFASGHPLSLSYPLPATVRHVRLSPISVSLPYSSVHCICRAAVFVWPLYSFFMKYYGLHDSYLVLTYQDLIYIFVILSEYWKPDHVQFNALLLWKYQLSNITVKNKT